MMICRSTIEPVPADWKAPAFFTIGVPLLPDICAVVVESDVKSNSPVVGDARHACAALDVEPARTTINAIAMATNPHHKGLDDSIGASLLDSAPLML
jgi:hypothetical protein